eukprot:GHRQ01032681.1.p2 GENE.GHRQ01032681.1~~GHRQ01032681.1.p2  ORF type:complete len:108 (+),score=19.34 GHRQ01032681.1:97-420(+)
MAQRHSHQPMRAPASEAAVTGPSAVCMTAPLKFAASAASVRSSGCTPSHTFFFCSGLGSRGFACTQRQQQHPDQRPGVSAQQQAHNTCCQFDHVGQQAIARLGSCAA